jgi:hypothetical protein
MRDNSKKYLWTQLISVYSEGLWQCCITFRITGFCGLCSLFIVLKSRNRINDVFQHPVSRHLLSSMKIDSLLWGLNYKMFTRKCCHYMFRLNWPSSGVLNVKKIAVLRLW